MTKASDETQRSLLQLYEAKELIAEALHHLADLAEQPRLHPDARQRVVEAVRYLADHIEEMD